MTTGARAHQERVGTRGTDSDERLKRDVSSDLKLVVRGREWSDDKMRRDGTRFWVVWVGARPGNLDLGMKGQGGKG